MANPGARWFEPILRQDTVSMVAIGAKELRAMHRSFFGSPKATGNATCLQFGTKDGQTVHLSHDGILYVVIMYWLVVVCFRNTDRRFACVGGRGLEIPVRLRIGWDLGEVGCCCRTWQGHEAQIGPELERHQTETVCHSFV